MLTQNFVKLFLCSDVCQPFHIHLSLMFCEYVCLTSLIIVFLIQVEMISLDEAAKILLGDAHDLSMMRSNDFSLCFPSNRTSY